MHNCKQFIILGAGGYIAPRHLKAIKETGNNLVAAVDPNDSVGILDSYFPNAEFFQNLDELDNFLKNYKDRIDFISICSPNYLHFPQIKFALEKGIDVICEKPLVLDISELDKIQKIEKQYAAKVYSILQLRLHPSIIALKEKVKSLPNSYKAEVELTYLTGRGKWYMKSWKGDERKSGGIASNIGVHFYDMLYFIFGDIQHSEIHYRDDSTASGYLEYAKAKVSWFLSIDMNMLPDNAHQGEKTTYRNIKIEGDDLEFSSGFSDLHTESYIQIFNGKGFSSDENRAAIKVVEDIRKNLIVDGFQKKHKFLIEAQKT